MEEQSGNNLGLSGSFGSQTASSLSLKMTVTGSILLSVVSDTSAAIHYSNVDVTLSTLNTVYNLPLISARSIYFVCRGSSIAGVGSVGGISIYVNGSWVSNLAYGAPVAGATLANSANLWTQFSGFFSQGSPGYIGFKFNPSGTDLYGWAHIDDVGAGKSSFHINGWAYDDTGAVINAGDQGGAGQAVPEPSGLALLACGAAGIYALRKKRKTV